MRGWGKQGNKFPQRLSGLATSTRLDRSPRQHKSDDKDHRFVVDIGRDAISREQAGRNRSNE